MPALNDRRTQAKVKTVRERLAQHRANASCATCHSMIDPAGFRWLNETWLKADRGATFYNTTPIGLDTPPGNYSTATDLARLARVMMRDPLVREIVSKPSARLADGIVVDNRNDLVGSYPWVVGVKTGNTGAAGIAVVDEDARRIGVLVVGDRHPAHVPVIADREQRQQADRRVFGRVQRACDGLAVDTGVREHILSDDIPERSCRQNRWRQIERLVRDDAAAAPVTELIADDSRRHLYCTEM